MCQLLIDKKGHSVYVDTEKLAAGSIAPRFSLGCIKENGDTFDWNVGWVKSSVVNFHAPVKLFYQVTKLDRHEYTLYFAETLCPGTGRPTASIKFTGSLIFYRRISILAGQVHHWFEFKNVESEILIESEMNQEATCTTESKICFACTPFINVKTTKSLKKSLTEVHN